MLARDVGLAERSEWAAPQAGRSDLFIDATC